MNIYKYVKEKNAAYNFCMYYLGGTLMFGIFPTTANISFPTSISPGERTAQVVPKHGTEPVIFDISGSAAILYLEKEFINKINKLTVKIL